MPARYVARSGAERPWRTFGFSYGGAWLYFERGWSYTGLKKHKDGIVELAEGGIWQIGGHARHRIARSQRPQGRAGDRRWDSLPSYGARTRVHPSPMALPAHARCPACGMVNTLDHERLGLPLCPPLFDYGPLVAESWALQPGQSFPCRCCRDLGPARKLTRALSDRPPSYPIATVRAAEDFLRPQDFEEFMRSLRDYTVVEMP